MASVSTPVYALLESSASGDLTPARLKSDHARAARRLEESYADFGAYTSPYARFWDDARLYDLPLGGVYGIPADRHQDRSHAPLPYLTEPQWRVQLALARDLVATNHFASGFRDHLAAFIGPVSVQFVLRGQSPGASASGPQDADGDGTPDVDPLVREATDCWEEWCEAADWGQGETDREAECLSRLLVEGECTLEFFKGGRGEVPEVRHVEPEFVRTPTVLPEGFGWATGEDWRWGVLTRPDDAERFLALYVADDPDLGDGGRVVRPDRFVRAKLADRVVKRGWSDFAPVADSLRSLTRLYDNMITVAALQAAIAWWEQYPTATPEQVRNVIEMGKDLVAFRGPSLNNRTSDVRRYEAGSVVRTEQRQVLPGPMSTGVAGFSQVAQNVLKGISFKYALPDFVAGEGGGSFASDLMAGSPTARVIGRRQLKQQGFSWRVAATVLRLSEESGRLPPGTCRRLKPVCTSQPVVLGDEEKKARTFLELYDKDLADPVEWIKSQKQDPKKVAANIAAWRAKFPKDPPPGMGPGPNDGPPPGPNATPPGSAGGDGSSPNADPVPASESRRVREGFDESAHPRDDHGKFVSGGDLEAAKADPAKAAELRARVTDPEQRAKLDAAMGGRNRPAFPDGRELATADRRHLKPGGEVSAVTVNGTNFVVKQRADTATQGAQEALVSDLAGITGVKMPVSRMTTVGGRPALVSEWVDGKTLAELQAADPAAMRQALRAVPKADIDRHALFDYILGHSDTHAGNYMLGADGLQAIDKEFVLGKGIKGQGFEPPAFLDHYHPTGQGLMHQFDAGSVRDMAAAGRRVAAHLGSVGRNAEARQVSDRVEVLDEMSRKGFTSAADLRQLSRKGVAPAGLGFLGKLKWQLTKN